jgi:TDG/mug DNA glycosylase family protein
MPLPDYLQPGLNLVFVGFNPGLKSDQLGHYYAGPGNQFWRFLYESGLTPRLLSPKDDASLPGFGIGLTDLVKRASRGSNDLSTSEFRSGLPILEQKLCQVQPRVVAFNGKSGYAAAIGRRCDYGQQSETLAGRPLYLCPSTSGALPMKREEKLKFYILLKNLLDDLRTGSGAR